MPYLKEDLGHGCALAFAIQRDGQHVATRETNDDVVAAAKANNHNKTGGGRGREEGSLDKNKRVFLKDRYGDTPEKHPIPRASKLMEVAKMSKQCS